MTSAEIRASIPLFSFNPSMVYLDSAATSLKPACVLQAMDDYYTHYGVNIHRGVYSLAYKATCAYESAREKVARAIGASTDEVIFTRGATDGLNMFASMMKEFIHEGDEIVTSDLEHHSSILPWQRIAQVTKAHLVYVPLSKEGRITVDGVRKVLSKKTKVVALTMLSNVMGYRTPIEEIVSLAHEKGAIVVADAAQYVPHFALNCHALKADAVAFSAHKVFGPTGIGALYVAHDLLSSLTPRDWGGDMIDEVWRTQATTKEAPYAYEAGTLPIAEIIGFGEAMDYLSRIGYKEIKAHDDIIRPLLLDGLAKISGITLYNPTADIALASFNIDGVHPHDVATYYDQDDIYLRAGHHCAELVMRRLEIDGTLRASAYVYNTPEEIQVFLAKTKDAVAFFKDLQGGC